jgi:hypothetical protein
MAATPQLLRTVPPTIDLSENINPKAIITFSPQQFRAVTYPATTWSQANAVWNILLPSPETILSRYIRMTVPITFTINATCKQQRSPAYVINNQYCGLCQYPLHQSIATMTLGLNNNSITIRPSSSSHYSSIMPSTDNNRRAICLPLHAIQTKLLNIRISLVK